jgi:hypothetical protein
MRVGHDRLVPEFRYMVAGVLAYQLHSWEVAMTNPLSGLHTMRTVARSVAN